LHAPCSHHHHHTHKTMGFAPVRKHSRSKGNRVLLPHSHCSPGHCWSHSWDTQCGIAVWLRCRRTVTQLATQGNQSCLQCTRSAHGFPDGWSRQHVFLDLPLGADGSPDPRGHAPGPPKTPTTAGMGPLPPPTSSTIQQGLQASAMGVDPPLPPSGPGTGPALLEAPPSLASHGAPCVSALGALPAPAAERPQCLSWLRGHAEAGSSTACGEARGAQDTGTR
jgi:hypothetical protein